MRYLITFSYDGTNFNGYQKQLNKRTIQEEIEKVLTKINNYKVLITASGRTDSKVHAINQKAHFDFDKKIQLEKLKNAMNSLLPDDIYIKRIQKVKKDFHARFDVVAKEYEYKINMGKYNPLERNYVYQYNDKLNINLIKEAIKYLEGTHNFKTFTKTTNEQKNYIRTIIKTEVKLKNNILTISFKGTGFLRYMVRNMIGTLICVGEGKIKPVEIKEMLKKQDRKCAPFTARPEGLYLKNVYYK